MLLVVGGGILGTLIVWHATRQGVPTVCVRRADRPAPEAETLRNQAWLQSGLVPHRKIGRVAALRMWTQGRRMLEEFGFNPDDGDAGVLRVPEDLVHDIEHAIDDLVLRGSVRRLQFVDAQARAGHFVRTGGVYYEIPDRPFPEAAIVEMARDEALATGIARFLEFDVPATISRVRQSIEVDAAGERLEADAVVLAAGIGSLALLDDIKHKHGITATSTPLVVIKSSSPLNCGLYVDLETHLAFSVTRQPPTSKTAAGALVLAGAPPARLPLPWHGSREVPRARADEVWRRVPSAAHGPCTTFTNLHRMGIEPQFDGQPKENPIVEEIDGCQHALYAFPGRATLAFSVAEEVVKRLGIVGALPTAPMPPSNAPTWAGPVSMHFEDTYDSVDELV